MAFLNAPTLASGTAKLQFDGSSFPVQHPFHPDMTQVKFTTLTGLVSIHESWSGSTAFGTVNRQALIPSIALRYLLWFVVSDLLWRLCRNVERGEVFSDRNLKLLRWLGAAIMVTGILHSLVQTWADRRLGQFVLENMTFEGLKVLSLAGSFWNAVLNALFLTLNSIVTGLLIFVVSEVFRQGLALKQESELTV